MPSASRVSMRDAVTRHAPPGAEERHVAWNNLGDRNLTDLSIADDLHALAT